MENSRYAILAIIIIASAITPTTDIVNMSLFAVPMCLLFFVGVFAGYILVLHREQQRFPWPKLVLWTLAALLILFATWLLATKYHYHASPHWPFLAP